MKLKVTGSVGDAPKEAKAARATRGPQGARQEVGRRGEQLAAAFYEGRGQEVLASNWRTRSGELDLVVRDEAARRLVFVEVRSLSRPGVIAPEQTVRGGKQARVRAQAQAWLSANAEYATGWVVCFDVVGVVLSTGELVHVPSAFEGE
ncbi:MAG: hypothetical protein CMH57_01415 [Myxococcales bacterium]|nr:hypothetical protein [Myxococcales bacterium]